MVAEAVADSVVAVEPAAAAVVAVAAVAAAGNLPAEPTNKRGCRLRTAAPLLFPARSAGTAGGYRDSFSRSSRARSSWRKMAFSCVTVTVPGGRPLAFFTYFLRV